MAFAQKRHAHARDDRCDDARSARAFKNGLQYDATVLTDVERPSAVEALIIKRQEGIGPLGGESTGCLTQ